MTKLTVSIPEACEMLSLSRSSLYLLLDEGALTKIKFGRRTLITVESIKAAVESRICNYLEGGEIAA